MFGAVVAQARAANQRRMIVTDDKKEAIRWASKLKGLQVGWDSLRLSGFRFLLLSDSKKVLGETYDNLVLDLRGSFSANDIGRIIPTVKGGGVIIILTPPFETWALSNLKYHERLAVPPYTVKDCKHFFIPRIIRKFYEHEGIWIHRKGLWEKESLEILSEKSKKPRVPANAIRVIYDLAKSQDQVDFLSEMEKPKQVTVLTANRGRGKSAALGLHVAAFRGIRDRKTEVVVVAPSRDGVKTVFEFIEKGLDALNIPYGYKNGILLGKKIKVVFEEPEASLARKADLFVVDEAAGIPFSILQKLSAKENVVFSTTVHGYEGAGRVFSMRFLSSLKKKGYKHLEMDTPIRYSDGDPIEGWLFDLLLLDAEPPPVKAIKQLEFNSPTHKELFSDEKLLTSVFGLLVSAHYKNSPRDLQTLADAPHHQIFTTYSGKDLVGVVQTAEEGGLTELQIDKMINDRRPEGNLVPDILAKHYGLREFPKLKGSRVVRIVT
ncbi:MAG: tRNA(Met) cytidine acetyltransferase, partial [Candidatus Altiarchaeota archaeon]|nr:tRNA(Met) cytidine acetyltransferase [Candidatus Altiarchaeota archaeon]